MTKLEASSSLEAKRAVAKIKSLRISPNKLSLVVGAVRRMRVENALVQLEFMRKRIAKDVKACLESAVANAENNHNMNIDRLFISEIYVGKSIVMKRMRARARGRSARIFKPFSHLTIILEEIKE